MTRGGSGSHWRRRGRAAELRKDEGSLAKRMDSVLITPSEGKTQDFLTSHGAGERESREPLTLRGLVSSAYSCTYIDAVFSFRRFEFVN